MSAETEGFLDAERAVNQLLTDLERLKGEVEGYANAKQTLETTRTQVDDVLRKLSQLAERSHDVIEALGKVGTSEILQQIDALRLANSGLTQSSIQLAKDVQESQTQATVALDKIGTNVAALRDSVLSVGENAESARTKSAAELAAVRASLDRRLKILTILVAIGIPLATAVIVVAICLARKFLGG
jgi:uncharacterized phage infection (PIP) family protein YhgE